ncbi:MAG: hypothetical protein FD174_1921 [Geobacteraceae bacterium]|nr:MAG: hypothetical protein FD174_1921 [Geobacteraceae bacterium]
MIIRKLSAGDTIEARCTRCRKVLNHTIVAMVGERVVRVECNTCRGVHNYHGTGETKAPVAGTSIRKTELAPRKSKKEPGAADREEWESLRPTMEKERAIAYDMNGVYRAHDLVEHPVFGLGVVTRVVGPSKVEVLFQGGKKLLRCR